MADILKCSCKKVTVTVVLTVLSVGFVFLGAYVFQFAEKRGNPHSDPREESVSNKMETFKKHTNTYVLDNIKSLMGPGLSIHNATVIGATLELNINSICEKITKMYSDEYGVRDFSASGKKKPFSFSQALFFSFSLLTTIGSGQSDLILRTDIAKGIVIPYAAIGIPLTLTWLMMLGTCLAHFVILMYNRCCCRCCNKRDSYDSNKNEDEDDDEGVECCKTTEDDSIGIPILILIIFCAIWIVLGIVALVHYEDTNSTWGYLDAALYIFTTLTTIGYTSKQPKFSSPNSDHGLITFVLYVLYIWIGLVLVASTVRLIFLVIDRFFSRNKDSLRRDSISY